MSLSLTQQANPASSKQATLQPVPPKKGDISACIRYAREMAQRSDKPYMEVIDSIFVRFLNWSYLNEAPRARRNK